MTLKVSSLVTKRTVMTLTWRVRISANLGERQRRQWHPTSALLPGQSYGWRSLVGCSPWGLEESDTTERLHFLSLFSLISAPCFEEHKSD